MTMLFNKSKTLTLLVLLLLMTLRANGNNEKTEGLTQSEIKKIDSLFFELINSDSPGASIAIVKGDKIAYANHYGLANLEYQIPITESSVFHVASLAKQFTAFSILLLEKEGKISLDDNVASYLSDLPHYEHEISIEDLIHHTSGIKDQWELIRLAGWHPDDVITEKQIMNIIYEVNDLNFKPGEKFQYSNTNYTLLAKIIEHVTREDFSSWVSKRIFAPLEMNHTMILNDYNDIVKNKAASYKEYGNCYKKRILNYSTIGATNLLTTTNDLARWIINFNKIIIGNNKVIKKMSQRGLLKNGDTIDYAFGLGVGKYNGKEKIYHSGSDAGYRSYQVQLPDDDLAIIVLSNLQSLDPEKYALNIADILTKNEGKTFNKNPKKGIEQKEIPQSILQMYIGKYELMPNFILTTWLEDQQLKGQLTGKNTVHTFIPKSNTEFSIPALQANIRFKEDQDEQIKLIMDKGGRTIIAKRIKEDILENAILEEYEGTFFSKELNTIYTLEKEDGRLLAKNKKTDDIKLSLEKKDLFTGSEWFFKEVEILRDSSKQVKGFEVSGSGNEGIVFEKMECQ